MIAVVHLVWGPLGPEPLRRFVDSYRSVSAGVDHELVIVWNGTDAVTRERLSPTLAGVTHTSVELEEPVLDLAAYGLVAERLTHDRLVFLNSYSVILADGWLAKLDGALSQAPGGIAGATGSWMGVRSSILNTIFLPSIYRNLLPPRRAARREFRAIQRELAIEARGDWVGDHTTEADLAAVSADRRVRRSAVALAALEQVTRMSSFPAFHIRTNGFMARRNDLTALLSPAPRRKQDAYMLESGPRSMTRRVLSRDGRVLVVDRRGDAYDHQNWPASTTLWQRDQAGLLIADNQTRSYTNGNLTRRRLLSALAWGPAADPWPAPGEDASVGT